MRANDAVDRVPRLIIKRLAVKWEGGAATAVAADAVAPARLDVPWNM